MNAQALYERGETHLHAGEWNLAAQQFNAVIELLPEHGCAHHLLGKAQAALGAWEAAEALQRRSCDLDPGLGWNWFALGELCEERGALHEAAVAYANAASVLREQRWIEDRSLRLQQRLAWQELRLQGHHPRFDLPTLVQIVWQLRPDLHLQCGAEQEGLMLWLLLEGPKEYTASLVLRDQLVAHFRPYAEQPALLEPIGLSGALGSEPPISQFLHEIWFQQPRLQRRFDLQTLAGRVGLFWWYVLEAVEHYQLHALLTNVELDYIHALQDAESVAPVVRLALAARRLANASIPDDALMDWLLTTASRQLHLQGLLCETRLQAVLGLRPQRPKALPVLPLQQAAPRSALPFGVNVIGYAHGQLGIGEDLRMAIRALDAVGVPSSVYNINPDHSIHCGDQSVGDRVLSSLPYRYNLFCLTGVETARIAVSDYLPMMLPDYYNIGFWPWEFSSWPAHWALAYRTVNEVWASTQFTFQAYRADAAVPVQLMPMVVDVSLTVGFSRTDFQLPEAAYLFVFAFDCSSSLQRKNPFAVIDAFQRAFPMVEESDVGLVVKVMRGQMSVSAYRRLVQRAKRDDRIYLVEDTLPREVLLDLYRACDCFVSLHRCEGFGRGMAEAMFLGKPVIATAYSGNLDFCTDLTALLVPAAMKRVVPGEYPEAQGMDWGDADVGQAAVWMRECALHGWMPDPEAVGRAAKRYSAAHAGKCYHDRLMEIRDCQR